MLAGKLHYSQHKPNTTGPPLCSAYRYPDLEYRSGSCVENCYTHIHIRAGHACSSRENQWTFRNGWLLPVHDAAVTEMD